MLISALSCELNRISGLCPASGLLCGKYSVTSIIEKIDSSS